MRIEKTSSAICCDICHEELYQRQYEINDGYFRATFITIHEKDICPTCSMELLKMTKISKEELEELIEKSSRKRKTLPISFTLDDFLSKFKKN